MELYFSIHLRNTSASNGFITRRNLIDIGLYIPQASEDAALLDQPLEEPYAQWICEEMATLLSQPLNPDIRIFLNISSAHLTSNRIRIRDISRNRENYSHDVIEKMLDSKIFFDYIEPHCSENNPVHLAISKKKEGLVDDLLKAGFNINGVYGSNFMSALCLAVQARHLPTVKILLESGADVHWRHPFLGINALDIAISESSDDIVQLLLEQKYSFSEWAASAYIRSKAFMAGNEKNPERNKIYFALIYKAISALPPYLAWHFMQNIWATLLFRLVYMYSARAISIALRNASLALYHFYETEA